MKVLPFAVCFAAVGLVVAGGTGIALGIGPGECVARAAFASLCCGFLGALFAAMGSSITHTGSPEK